MRLPADLGDLFVVQTDDGHVAFPADFAGRVRALDLLEPHPRNDRVGDFVHGDERARRKVEEVDLLLPLFLHQHERVDHVVDVEVGFALLAVSQNVELGAVFLQTLDEVEHHAVRGARPDDVGWAENPRLHVVEVHECRDETLGPHLGGPVHRDRLQRTVGLGEVGEPAVAVHAAPRGVDELFDAVLPHRLEQRKSGNDRVLEIERRVMNAARDIGVRGQVKHQVDLGAQDLGKLRRVADIDLFEAKPG